MQTQSTNAKEAGAHMAAQWRRNIGVDNPAGPLFVGGEFAEADIISDINALSGHCGTLCTASNSGLNCPSCC